jgi:hypothetical protein
MLRLTFSHYFLAHRSQAILYTDGPRIPFALAAGSWARRWKLGFSDRHTPQPDPAESAAFRAAGVPH